MAKGFHTSCIITPKRIGKFVTPVVLILLRSTPPKPCISGQRFLHEQWSVFRPAQHSKRCRCFLGHHTYTYVDSGGPMVIIFTSGSEVCGFKPGRSRWTLYIHIYMTTPVVPWLSYSPLDPRYAGSNQAGVDGFFQRVKIVSMTYFGTEGKQWVPCRRYMARKGASSRY